MHHLALEIDITNQKACNILTTILFVLPCTSDCPRQAPYHISVQDGDTFSTDLPTARGACLMYYIRKYSCRSVGNISKYQYRESTGQAVYTPVFRDCTQCVFL